MVALQVPVQDWVRAQVVRFYQLPEVEHYHGQRLLLYKLEQSVEAQMLMEQPLHLAF